MDHLQSTPVCAIAIACNRRFKAPSADPCTKRVHERCEVPPKGKKTLEIAVRSQHTRCYHYGSALPARPASNPPSLLVG
jgi:hypothetical protein